MYILMYIIVITIHQEQTIIHQDNKIIVQGITHQLKIIVQGLIIAHQERTIQHQDKHQEVQQMEEDNMIETDFKKMTYNDYLVNVINQVLETNDDKKREKQLKDMIVEINSTNDNDRLQFIAEELDYLIKIIESSI